MNASARVPLEAPPQQAAQGPRRVGRQAIPPGLGLQDLGVPLKARQAIRVTGHRSGQYLDRNLAFQIRVGRAVDLAHPADANLRGDFVNAEQATGGESQGGDYTGGIGADGRGSGDHVVLSPAWHDS